jgi:hypothetical protein
LLPYINMLPFFRESPPVIFNTTELLFFIFVFYFFTFFWGKKHR